MRDEASFKSKIILVITIQKGIHGHCSGLENCEHTLEGFLRL